MLIGSNIRFRPGVHPNHFSRTVLPSKLAITPKFFTKKSESNSDKVTKIGFFNTKYKKFTYSFTSLMKLITDTATNSFKYKLKSPQSENMPLPSYNSLNASSLPHVVFKDEFKFKESFKATQPDKDLFALGGYSESLDRVADLVRYLQDPEGFKNAGVSAPKGIILSGPPGTGKTFMAEAVAGHAGVSFILVGCGEICQTSVGASEAYIRALFEFAATQAPCVVCLDELESIATKRVTSATDANQIHLHYINNTINQLLTLLSKDHPGIVFIGTTNHYDLLDSAVVRPGRFDRHIALSLPNKEERKQILELHVKKMRLDSDVSLDDFATLSTGFSGAKLEALTKEAALTALRQNAASISVAHFDEAFDSLTGISQSNCEDLGHKMLTAAHESGHAFVAHHFGIKIYKISILKRGGAVGLTVMIPPENQNPTKQELLNLICINMAGRAAENILHNSVTGCSTDFEIAKQIANDMVYKEGMGETFIGISLDVEKILQTELSRAKTILTENRATWERIRDHLVSHEVIFKEDFIKLVNGEKIKAISRNFFWNKPSKGKTTLALPPKKPHHNPKLDAFHEKSSAYPFTISELAKALNVNPSSIDTVNKVGGYEILFSFADNSHLINISMDLDKEDIRNVYNRDKGTLYIARVSIKDFDNYVKNKNK